MEALKKKKIGRGEIERVIHILYQEYKKTKANKQIEIIENSYY